MINIISVLSYVKNCILMRFSIYYTHIFIIRMNNINEIIFLEIKITENFTCIINGFFSLT